MVDTVSGQYTIYCDKLNAIGWERSTDERFSTPAARLSSSHAELDPALQRPTDMSRTVEAILAHAQLLAPHHRHREAINQLTGPERIFECPPLQFTLANQHSAKDSYGEVARFFLLVLQVDPLSIPALANLASALMWRGEGESRKAKRERPFFWPRIIQRCYSGWPTP
jgi:hypothetical protein